jgi:hypothetical protein
MDKKISELEEIKFEEVSDSDMLLISDMDEEVSKKISIQKLKELIKK